MGQSVRALQTQEDGHLTHAPNDAARGANDAASADETDADNDKEARARLERGRLLFAAPWVFLKTSTATAQLPPDGPVEVAFAGRSNVGKSTLLNALTGQKGLAKASNTPGRTRALNLFARADGSGPMVVDMPGYGYARAPKTEVAAWTRLVFDYLRGRPSLRRVFLLVDARHGLKAVDEAAMDVMDEAAVSYQIVLTKADKKDATPAVVDAAAAAIAKRPAAHPQIQHTSATSGLGLDELRAQVADLLVG